MESACILRAEGLSLDYEGDKALFQNLNLKVPAGGFIAVVGSSGSGKTTLLKLLGGFLRPGKGQVFLDGKILREPSPRAVMVFQEFDQLFPWKTVFANVAFPLRSGRESRRDKDIQEKTASILEEVGLAGYEKYYPFQLSGGMKQRAALARALVSGAPVLLMDEPFGSLDALRREELQRLLLRMWSEYGLSVVFVTHDITEALLLADTVLVLDSGGRKAVDSPRTGASGPLEIPIELSRPRSSSEPGFMEYYRRIYGLL